MLRFSVTFFLMFFNHCKHPSRCTNCWFIKVVEVLVMSLLLRAMSLLFYAQLYYAQMLKNIGRIACFMKALVFDFDGVIHDTFELTYHLYSQIRGRDASREQYRSFFDGNLYEKIGSMYTKEMQDEFRRMESEAYKDLQINTAIRDDLVALSKQFSLFIISSNSIRNLELYMKNNQLTGIFKDILAVETHTSKVEKFKMVFARYDISPEHCLFVTDTLGDVLEAHAVGVRSLACTFGYHDAKRLEKGKPFKLINTFKEIRDAVEHI